MNVDEMNLLGKVLETPPLRPETYVEARQKLRSAMNEAPVRSRGQAFWRSPRSSRRNVGIGAGIGALAAAAAVVFAVTSTSQPATPPPSVTAPATVAESELIVLATKLQASNNQPGDASLVIRTQYRGEGPGDVSYNLYTDAGSYYGGVDRLTLAQAVAKGEKDDAYALMVAKAVEAALSAADGDIEAARVKMVDAQPNSLGLGRSDAERQRIWDEKNAENAEIYQQKGFEPEPNPPTGERLEKAIGNRLWASSLDVLATAGAVPEVRAGVLRLLESVPQIKVEETTTEGRATLTLTAGPELTEDLTQVLVIDAGTGAPISLANSAIESADVPASRSTYEVSRVTVADL